MVFVGLVTGLSSNIATEFYPCKKMVLLLSLPTGSYMSFEQTVCITAFSCNYVQVISGCEMGSN